MRRKGWQLALAGILLLAGCHSALFQTAKIRNGTNATLGITKIDAAENPDISDYSIFIKGEVGREARRSRPGYSLGLTFVVPVRNRYRSTFTSRDREIEMFPNEWAGIFPEFKFQMPRVLPVDAAADFRFIGYLPERAALLLSYDLVDFVTLYGSLSYNVAVAPQMALGTEVTFTRRFSVLFEYASWLADHDYPDDFTGSVMKRPYSVGIAVAYNWPRAIEPYDSRRFTSVP
ncbi:MAG: hypothetical protein ABIJ00_00785 [Candidatus Eisenbacteria bacterium]